MSQFCGSFPESSNRCGVTCARALEAKPPKPSRAIKASCIPVFRKVLFIGHPRKAGRRSHPEDLYRSTFFDRTPVGPDAASLSLHHMARAAARRPVEKLLPVHHIPNGGGLTLFLHAPNVADHLPYLFFRHAHALLCRSVRRHGRARNSLVNGSKQIGIRASMAFLRARQIRSPASAPRAQSVAKGAVCAKFKFAELCRSRIAGKGILVLGLERCREHSNNEQQGAGEKSARPWPWLLKRVRQTHVLSTEH